MKSQHISLNFIGTTIIFFILLGVMMMPLSALAQEEIPPTDTP